MDERGFSFTPLAFLLMIPIIIIAVAFSGIINEINVISQIGIGGDVTYTAANNVFVSIENGAKAGGRRAAYNATRYVIDREAQRVSNPFYGSGKSKEFIREYVANATNENIVNTCLKIQNETGRQIYINNILIDSYSDKPFNASHINITQTDPFTFNVIISKGIPVTVVQKDQNATLMTPQISVSVSIENLEDPYVWIYSKNRISNVIYKYPYYTTQNNDYHFAGQVYPNRLENLAYCLNGTNNPSGITPRPYYFPDQYGLSFFDRLEGRNVSTETNTKSRMSTFIVGNPLSEEEGYSTGGRGTTPLISCVDNEYFRKVSGANIRINLLAVRDYGALSWPDIAEFRISDTYLGRLGLQRTYTYP